MIELQRVCEHRKTQGTRFLVQRLWPRGIRKKSLHFSASLKDVAPSNSLRRWFLHDVAKWTQFHHRCSRMARPFIDGNGGVAACPKALQSSKFNRKQENAP